MVLRFGLPVLLGILMPAGVFAQTPSPREGSQAAGGEIAADQLKEACAVSYEAAQRKRSEGDFLAAEREALFCAQSGCPSILASDCSRWTDELGRVIPSVVLEPKSSESEDILEGRYRLDGGAWHEFDGKRLRVNPGKHHVEFTSEAGKTGASFVVDQGQDGLRIALRYRERTSKEASPQSAAGLPSAAVWSLGSIAAASFVSFAILGAAGLDKKQKLSDCSPTCPADRGREVSDYWVAADLSLLVSVASASGLFAWWLLADDESVPTSTLAPPVAVVGYQRGAGVALSGQF